ncbi:hypothetical protein BGZ95_010327 [Linnemannia exigua]|uniref:Uncharacterized protein n=1 Tax=Linnemannia exigua TaxID=604196 RepID=A0AAD4DDL6_9FUNG|nr:hypothetical protein BGZ95_010327 [Linnemannia exigua]
MARHYGGGGGGGGDGEGGLSDTAWAIIGVLIAMTVIYCIYYVYKKTCASPTATQDPEAPAATPQAQAVAASGKPAVMTQQQQQQTYTPANNTYQQTTAYAPMTQAPAAAPSPYIPASSYAPASPYPPSTPYTPTTPYAAPAAYPPSTGYPPMSQPAYGAPPAPVGGFVAQYPPQPQQPGQLGTTYL